MRMSFDMEGGRQVDPLRSFLALLGRSEEEKGRTWIEVSWDPAYSLPLPLAWREREA